MLNKRIYGDVVLLKTSTVSASTTQSNPTKAAEEGWISHNPKWHRGSAGDSSQKALRTHGFTALAVWARSRK